LPPQLEQGGQPDGRVRGLMRSDQAKSNFQPTRCAGRRGPKVERYSPESARLCPIFSNMRVSSTGFNTEARTIFLFFITCDKIDIESISNKR
jgi:hypothetical protein